jgi:hypothetical protein
MAQRSIAPVGAWLVQNPPAPRPVPPPPPPADEVPEAVAQAARLAVRTHPSFVGVIPAAARPACLRSIARHGEVPASSEVHVGEWVAQAGRRQSDTDAYDGLHLWRPGMAEAVRVDGVWPS